MKAEARWRLKTEGPGMKKTIDDLDDDPSSIIPHRLPLVHHPSKRLGQNFLTDQRIIHRIVESLAPKADETIIEIGPGRGALTTPLLESAGRLVAVEFDRNLIPALEESFGSKTNFQLVQ